jgi:hypothetical protein
METFQREKALKFNKTQRKNDAKAVRRWAQNLFRFFPFFFRLLAIKK